MVIDSSALLAILLDEPEAVRLLVALEATEERHLTAPSLVELSAVVLARKGMPGEIALDALLQRLEIDVVAMSPEAAVSARSAYRRFGKGIGSPGVLNFGDCLVYGVAATRGEEVLCKGGDFAHTDIALAAY